MKKQHYMLKFQSDKPEIDVEYGYPQIYINEVLMVGDLFSFDDVVDMKADLIEDYSTYQFVIKQRELSIVEKLTEEPDSYILLTLEPVNFSSENSLL